MSFEKDRQDGLDFRLLTKDEIEELGGTPPGRSKPKEGKKKKESINMSFVRIFAELTGVEQKEVIEMIRSEI